MPETLMHPDTTAAYEDLYARSLEDPEGFWAEQAEAVPWMRRPTRVLGKDRKNYTQWFADGELNMAHACLDHHVEAGHGAQVAVIHDSPVTGTVRHITYAELRDRVARVAGGLRALGLEKGDTAIVYMPMIPEAIVAMLACARLGVTHSVVFGGFAPHELALRIDDCRPKAVLTASSGIEVDQVIPYKPYVDAAIREAEHRPERVVVFDRGLGAEVPRQDRDVDWAALEASAEPVAPVPVPSTHPLYILYTSGTTGKPKGIQRDTGGYATALLFSMAAVYDSAPGEVFWAASDVGWVVGHSYIVYGPLLNRNTTVLYEGKPVRTPDAAAFWRVIAEHRVRTMFTAPTAIRAIRKEDPSGEGLRQHDCSCLRHQFLAGERCDAATLEWLEERLGVPVIDHWWQTESGWPMLAAMAGLGTPRVKTGSAGRPVCGYDVRVLHEDGRPCAPGEQGLVTVRMPLPPGTLTDLWGNTERFFNGYFRALPGHYLTGDGGYADEEGFVYITGRVDDVINVAGHRLSTAEMEEVLARHHAVAECAVVGAADDLKGQVPLGIVVTKPEATLSDAELQAELVRDVRREIGPVAALKRVVVVPRLPKTRSGKTLRKLLRAMADGEAYTVPSTIEDAGVLPELEARLGPRA